MTYWQEMWCNVVSRSTEIAVEVVYGGVGLEREEIILPQNVNSIYGARGIPGARPETQLQQLVGFVAAAFLLEALNVIRGRGGGPASLFDLLQGGAADSARAQSHLHLSHTVIVNYQNFPSWSGMATRTWVPIVSVVDAHADVGTGDLLPEAGLSVPLQ